MSPFLRHLPPTAVPIGLSELRAGLSNDPANLANFRAALAAYVGTVDAFLAASGRTALYLLLRGLQIDDPTRTEVVLPAYTCPSLVKVILDLQLKPVFVDLSSQTFGIDLEVVETAVTPHTLALIVVHPFGIPQPVDPLLSLAHAMGAVVIEDAAQALGAKWDGQPVGIRGDFGLYSLGPGKPISTAGGGIVVSSKPENQARLARWWSGLLQPNSAASAQAWLRQTAFQMAFHPAGWWAAARVGLHKVGNHESSWGYRQRGLTPAQAGVGLALLPQLDAINQSRRQNAESILAGVRAGENVEQVVVGKTAEPIYLRLPLLSKNFETRERLYEQLWAAGIGVGRMYERPLPAIFPGITERRFVNAEKIAACLLTLPTHHHITSSDIAAIHTALQS